MLRVAHIKQQCRRSAPALISAFMVMYFLSHALSGSNSLKALKDLERDTLFLRAEAAVISDRRQWLEKRVANLKSTGMAPDLLDELARNRLSVAQPDEVILVLGDVGQ